MLIKITTSNQSIPINCYPCPKVGEWLNLFSWSSEWVFFPLIGLNSRFFLISNIDFFICIGLKYFLIKVFPKIFTNHLLMLIVIRKPPPSLDPFSANQTDQSGQPLFSETVYIRTHWQMIRSTRSEVAILQFFLCQKNQRFLMQSVVFRCTLLSSPTGQHTMTTVFQSNCTSFVCLPAPTCVYSVISYPFFFFKLLCSMRLNVSTFLQQTHEKLYQPNILTPHFLLFSSSPRFLLFQRLCNL